MLYASIPSESKKQHQQNQNLKLQKDTKKPRNKGVLYGWCCSYISVRVDSFRYLGVRIHIKLTWTDHVSEVRMKATRVLHLLRRAMQGYSKQANARAYIALVCPHLETCSPVWTPYQKGAQNRKGAEVRSQVDMCEVG